MTGRQEPETVHHNSLVPPHRRARVVLTFVFLAASLSFLSYVSVL
ncbi:hypothetical protein [Marinobacter sp. HL-58]|nr:hypothetical protein [Marinobacter sp. HL-58]KPP99901.1 MAG: hypothetical protein HLUCCO03_16355 [Marinobacter sp. HL-58]